MKNNAPYRTWACGLRPPTQAVIFRAVGACGPRLRRVNRARKGALTVEGAQGESEKIAFERTQTGRQDAPKARGAAVGVRGPGSGFRGRGPGSGVRGSGSGDRAVHRFHRFLRLNDGGAVPRRAGLRRTWVAARTCLPKRTRAHLRPRRLGRKSATPTLVASATRVHDSDPGRGGPFTIAISVEGWWVAHFCRRGKGVRIARGVKRRNRQVRIFGPRVETRGCFRRVPMGQHDLSPGFSTPGRGQARGPAAMIMSATAGTAGGRRGTCWERQRPRWRLLIFRRRRGPPLSRGQARRSQRVQRRRGPFDFAQGRLWRSLGRRDAGGPGKHSRGRLRHNGSGRVGTPALQGNLRG